MKHNSTKPSAESTGDRRTALGALLAVGVAAGSYGTAQAKTAPAPVDTRVDQLMSRWQIEEVLFAYARGNDRNDPDMVRNCFWPESTHKHGRFEGLSYDFVGYAAKIIATLKHAAHFITNVSIQVDGDRAFSECYYLAHHRRDAKDGSGEEDAFMEGRYLDLFERRDGVWKIIRRRGLSDLTAAPIPAPSPYADWPAGMHSGRDKDDDYYKMLEAFRAGK
ncbi:hypothetical protein MB02_10055 [Croceicoccus estronivorus]|nr:hypothetical protein MB02_10055 [Croceicoccus estronivorus]